MSLAFQAIFANRTRTFSLISLSPTNFCKPSNSPFSRSHFPDHTIFTSRHHILPLRKIKATFAEIYGTSNTQSDGNEFKFDTFLSVLEFLSLASSAAISLYVALSYGLSKVGVLGWLGSKVFVWQCVFLVTGVLAGAVIRRRQWRRVCGPGFSRGSASYGANLLGRVEKMEEDLRSSATLIRVLSRQIEKLGIRVRAARKALREPISETAAFAQKNSEATRALAAQEDVLAEELGEIQKVLLAMQEQQQKQLDLILAIGTAKKLWDTKEEQSRDVNTSKTVKSSVAGEANQNEILGVAKASKQ